MDANYWIKQLQLIPHKEGGYYTETFKSNDYIKNSDKIFASSLIYFLLTNNQFSAFHRLKNDEVWIYHYGQPVTIHIINSNGILESQILGIDVANGHKLQVTIRANSWFAAEMATNNGYCLMSCLVSPGFHWHDFELAKNENLLSLYPQHSKLIKRLCK